VNPTLTALATALSVSREAVYRCARDGRFKTIDRSTTPWTISQAEFDRVLLTGLPRAERKTPA
jgi:hypothetical protein